MLDMNHIIPIVNVRTIFGHTLLRTIFRQEFASLLGRRTDSGICFFLKLAPLLAIEFQHDVCIDCFHKVHQNSVLHRQIISQIQTKRSGVGVKVVWWTPTPTPGSLPRLRATPTPTPTPHPCQRYKKTNHRKQCAFRNKNMNDTLAKKVESYAYLSNWDHAESLRIVLNKMIR